MPKCVLCGDEARIEVHPDGVERTHCLKCRVRIPVQGIEVDEARWPSWRQRLIQAALWFKHLDGRPCTDLDSVRLAEWAIARNDEFLKSTAECRELAIQVLVRDEDPKGGPWGDPIRYVAEALAKPRDEAESFTRCLRKDGAVEIFNPAASVHPLAGARALPVAGPHWVRLPAAPGTTLKDTRASALQTVLQTFIFQVECGCDLSHLNNLYG